MSYIVVSLIAFIAGAVSYKVYASRVIDELSRIVADAKKAEMAAREAIKK